jgi:hypothetical protein
VWLATGVGEALVSGRYLKRRTVHSPNPAAGDVGYQDGLLRACADLCGVELPAGSPESGDGSPSLR